MSRSIAYSSLPPAQHPTPGNRGTLAIVAGALFVLALLFYTSSAIADVLFRLLIDGPLLLAWLLAAWGYGWGLLDTPRLFRGDPPGALLLRHVTRTAAGLGAMSLLTLGLGLAGLLNQVTAIVLVAVGFVLLIVAIAVRRGGRSPTSSALSGWFAAPAGWHWLLLALVPVASITAAGGLVPPGVLWGVDDPAGYDVVEYHLQIPREWLDLGHITPLHHNVFSYFPFNVEMHYLLAMHLHGGAWSGMYLAQWMHGAMVVLTLVAVYAAARTLTTEAVACAVTVAAGACPWLAMLGSVAYNEGGLLLYTTLAAAWILRMLGRGVAPQTSAPSHTDLANAAGGERPPLTPSRPELAKDLPGEGRGEGSAQSPLEHPATPPAAEGSLLSYGAIAGLMAGFACGCKLTGVPTVLVALPVAAILAALIGQFPRNLLPRLITALVVYVAIGTAAFAPWLIRNQAWAHNPVFPEGTHILGPAHFSPLQVDRWQKAHSPRPDQQSVGARFTEFGHQVLADWRYAYLLLPVALILGVIAIRRPGAVFLIASVLAFAAFWLFFTHLQSRFFVTAIPLLALLLALVPNPRLALGAALLVTVAAVPSLITLHQKFAPLGIAFGLDSPHTLRDAIYPDDVNAVINDQSKPLVLVGDAKVFWYDVPMSRLHYRTVFDVDTSDSRGAVPAWIGDAMNLPEGTVIIDPAELDRFSRTYLGIPPLAPPLNELRRPTPFDLHDPALKR